jgi:hypothetical protein
MVNRLIVLAALLAGLASIGLILSADTREASPNLAMPALLDWLFEW